MFYALLRHFLFFLLYGTLGLFIGVATFYVLQMNARPDLQLWHTVRLSEEFRAGDEVRVPDLKAYTALEDRLFAQLDRRVYAGDDASLYSRVQAHLALHEEDAAATVINRYGSGSRADYRSRTPDWNRTVILPAEKPRGAVLLLHGLSDSPYSLRAMALHLQQQGWSVVVLRQPGHGTAPSALLDVQWEDWAAATRMAARDLQRQVGADKPLLLVGYSTGAALAVEYALARQAGEALPRVSQLVLLSPAIGVSSAARFASWQRACARIPGLSKLAWVDLLPEYDPYKYGSFAVNAGEQIWRLTRHINTQLTALEAAGKVAGLPPMLAFQSVADATVSAPAVLDVLFRRLSPKDGHALVLFDANRLSSTRPLLRQELFSVRDRLLQGPALPFDLTVVTNTREDGMAVSAWERAVGQRDVRQADLGLQWPAGMFALSHVALPMAPDDALYGATAPASPQQLYLGRLAVFGERGLLLVPEASLLRARYNPFFSYVLARTDAVLAP